MQKTGERLDAWQATGRVEASPRQGLVGCRKRPRIGSGRLSFQLVNRRKPGPGRAGGARIAD